MLQHVKDLMTPSPMSISQNATLKDAHAMMKEHNIRHIPVTNDQNQLIGMLTQKVMISTVMGIISTYGNLALERKEKHTPVSDIMVTDFAKATPEQSLQSLVNHFVNHRHGCMPVVNQDNQLVGILTSSDFVRLAAALLS